MLPVVLTGVAIVASLVYGGPAEAAGRGKVRVALRGPSKASAGSTVSLHTRLSHPVRGARVTLQSKSGARWVAAATRRPRGRSARLHLGVPTAGDRVVVRALVWRGEHTIARSRRKIIRVLPRVGPSHPTQPGVQPAGPVRVREGAVSYTVPAGTLLYDSAQVGHAVAAGSPDEAFVTLAPGAPAPAVGGHVAIGPGPGLPDGMFAAVLAIETVEGGAWRLHLRRAAIDEVLDEVSVDFEGPVSPVLVDENGAPTGEGGLVSASRHGVVLKGSAVFEGAPVRSAGAAGSMFECSGDGGIPADPGDVWETGNPFPIELQIQNTRMTHVFDSGSLFPHRDPLVLIQLSGEAVASIGFKAKAGFTCELSPTFGRSHRLQLRLPNIGPVPVSLYLEPTLEFGVSASGKIGLSQRHYFAFTLEKNGFDPLEFSKAYSRDPAVLGLGADLSGSLFAGGDLSLMVGGGVGSANALAGLAGAFGPEVTLEPAQQLGCVDVNAAFRASLEARLELWVKRWNLELATLTVGKTRIAGPKCVFDADVPDETVGGPVGPAGPPTPFTRETHDFPYPMGDGRWLIPEHLGGTAWRYVVVSETGEELSGWDAGYEPLSVVSAPDGTTYLMALDPSGSDLLNLVRISPGGASRKTKMYEPSSFAPGIQRLALSPSGRLFWLYSLPPGTHQGVAEVDTTTLQRISSKPLGFSNGGITPTPTGLTINNYASAVWRIPYGAFTPNDDSPFDFGAASVSPNTESSDRLMAVGLDGTIGDVGYFPYDCADRSVSWRGPDGTSWERKLGQLLGAEEPPGCEIQDLDVLPDGQLVATLLADDGVYQLRIARDGSSSGLLKVGGDDALASTVIDASGTAFTAYTQITNCEPEASDPYCAEVRVARVSDDGTLLEPAILDGPQQVVGAGTFLVGQPYLAVGKGQVMVRVVEGERLSSDFCRRSCGPGGTPVSQLRTTLVPATPSGRASFSWWGG